MSRFHCALSVAVFAVACNDEPSVALIGVMMGNGVVQAALQEAIDATHQEGMLRIAVAPSSGTGVLPLTEGDSDNERVLSSAYGLAAEPAVLGVVGPGGSHGALLAGPVFREAGLAFVMPMANSPQIAGLAPTGLSLAPTLEAESSFIGQFVAHRLGAGNALLFYEIDEWGLALQRQVAAALRLRGVRVLEAVPVGAYSCSSPTEHPAGAEAALHRHQPDVVIAATRSRVTVCLAEVVQRLAPGTPMVSGDGTEATPSLLEQLGDAADLLYSVSFWHHSVAGSTGAFGASMEQARGRPPSLAEGMTFEATMLLVQAIREVGADREAVLQYVAEMSRGQRFAPSPEDPDRQAGPRSRLLMLRSGVPVWSGSDETAHPVGPVREP
ncbi:MAG: amino acid ABC transporter substrate-binding protein [Gemmatimonadota bacterium]|nr:MAG: amino acid ABC transporter substrate-binding protein [Gemmatimonadota bacterium]